MNKPLLLIIAVLLSLPLTAAKKAQKPAVIVTDLRTERMVNPMSIDTPTPRLGWRIESTEQNVKQAQCHIIVASSREKAEALQGDLWDATLQGDQSQWVTYQGKPLKSNTRCYWRVQVLTSHPSPLTSPWSDIALWNVGLLTEGDWRGRWIGLDRAMPWDVESEHSRLSARYLRTEFQLDKPVRQATLYICGLGMYEAFINGQRVGDQVLAPMPTDYRRTVLYNAYDVTSQLSTRPNGTLAQARTLNAIAVVLGNGRYYTMQQKKKPYKITNFGYPTLRANLIIEFEDGSRKVVATDEKWKLNVDGPIRSNNEYDGEVYDARKEFGRLKAPSEAVADWTMPGFDDSSWMKAERTAIPYGTLRGQMSPGMKVVKTVKPQSVTQIGDKLIIDMGQNIAGWLKLRIVGEASKLYGIVGEASKLYPGDSIIIRYAEKLDSTGNIWTENLRHAQSTDRYYASGNEAPDTWWHPVFSYHGFRYVEVTGLIKHGSLQSLEASPTMPQSLETSPTMPQSLEASPTTDDFVAEVISDAMEETGHFTCDNAILNKVYQNARWGILANYKGMPVDCPQRDERQPWLGDRTRGCFGEAFLFDNQTLYAKWARDICEAQREDGCIPDVAPAFWNYYSDDLTWAAALPMTLKMLRDHYGDEAPLQKHYANVKRWLEHLKDRYQRDGIIYCGKYADWCVPPEREDLIHSEDPARKTDVALISTAYYYYLCKMIGEEDEARLTKEAFNRKFLTVKRGTATVPDHWLYPDSTYYGNNTVTANVLPYVFGMIDDDYVKRQVEKQIVKKLLDQNDGTVTCGVIGIGWLMHALTQMGRTDLAWLLATNKKYPSWGYMAEHGATTIWELWNGDTASPKMNSGNHVMLLGDLLSWLYEDVAGIAAAEPGFKHIAMHPDFSVDEIDHIDASYQSIYGKIVSRWKKEHGQLSWHVEIPANTQATLTLPDGTLREVGSGVHELRVAVGAVETTGAIENPAQLQQSQWSKKSQQPQILVDEFLYKDAPFPSCHSATIVETKKGDLVATFFGGTKERNPDVSIWVCRKPKGAKDWTAPVMVADGVELQPVETVTADPADKKYDGSKTYSQAKPAFGGKFTPYPEWKGNWGEALVDGVHREAAWNPVLFEMPDGVLHLYFKIGPNVANWKGWRITSKDGGKTWSRREQLPDSIYGPIKNKPIQVGNRLISPTSDERSGWRCYFELSDDNGKTWRRTAFVEADKGVQAIQPAIIQLPDGRLEALCRTRSRHIGVTFSDDNGETWSRLQLIDTPNNNSGIDAVTLNWESMTAAANSQLSTLNSQLPGFALICNDWPIEPDKQKGARTPLSILRSDDGLHWEHWVTLEDSPISQYSYPSIIQTRDGHLHAIYTWRRQRIKHVELVP